jgi:hypothetical protein
VGAFDLIKFVSVEQVLIEILQALGMDLVRTLQDIIGDTSMNRLLILRYLIVDHARLLL